MKIAHVNKFYYERGGAERVMFSMTDALERRGHTVVPFAMEHPRNERASTSRFFPPFVPFGAGEATSFRDQLRVLPRMFWSPAVARSFDAFLRAEQPDIIHLHNIYHQLSPSILPVARRHGIPVVMSVHDWKLIWPDYLLCGYAPGASYWNVVRERCVQGSRMKSTLVVLEKKFHDLLRVYTNSVRTFLAPSVFVRDMLALNGVPSTKIVHLSHVIPDQFFAAPRMRRGVRPTVLFFGRLAREKGIDTIVHMLDNGVSDATIAIAGYGPEYPRLAALAKRRPEIQLLGHLEGDDLIAAIDRAHVVVAPSFAPETFGLSILEAFARRRSVVASRVGAYPELVRDGVNGILVPPGDPFALADGVATLLKDPSLRKRYEARARATAGAFTETAIIDQLLAIYQSVITP